MDEPVFASPALGELSNQVDFSLLSSFTAGDRGGVAQGLSAPEFPTLLNESSSDALPLSIFDEAAWFNAWLETSGDAPPEAGGIQVAAGEGAIAFTGSAQTDALFLGVGTGNRLTYSTNGLEFIQVESVDFSTGLAIDVDLQGGDDRFAVSRTLISAFQQFGGRLNFSGGAGDDVLGGPSGDALWQVTGENSGILEDSISFRQVENLTGFENNQDTFTIGAEGRLSGGVDGGQGGYDTLIVENQDFAQVTLTASNPDSGRVILDGQTLTYAGLEPITIQGGTIADLVIDLGDLDQVIQTPNGATVVPSTDEAVLAAGPAGQLSFVSNSVPAQFESLFFDNPTNSLTVKLGLGDDTLRVRSLDPGFLGSLALEGNGGDDTIILEENLTLAQSFSISGGDGVDAIAVQANVTLPGQAVNFAAENIGVGFALGESTRFGIGERDARPSQRALNAGLSETGWTSNQVYTGLEPSETSGTGSGMTVEIAVDDEGTPIATLLTAGAGYTVGDTVTFADPDGNGESITLTVLSAATGSAAISTRATNPADDAGRIAIGGEMIGIGLGASLLADSLGTGAAGDVSLTVAQTSGFDALDLLSDVDVGLVGIVLNDGATVRGGNVSFSAAADHSRVVGVDENGETSGSIGDAILNGIAGVAETITILAGAAISTTDARIRLGRNSSVFANTFAAEATATSNASVAPIAIGAGVAFGRADTTATVVAEGSIQTTGDLTLRSTADNTLSVVADTSNALGAAGAVAISLLDSDSLAHVTDDANLTVGGALLLDAKTVDRNFTLARSTAGDDGFIGVAVSVSDESGDTNAFLDGTVDVAGNLEVRARQNKEAIEANKLFVVPSLVTGVAAAAGVGSDSKGDLLADTQSAAIGQGINFVKTQLLGPSQPKPGAVQSFDLPASVAYVNDENRAKARIGDGGLDGDAQSGDTETDGTLTLSATADNRPDVTAASGASSGNDNPNADESQFGGSAALALGFYTNDAQAWINTAAEVDSGDALTVQSQALNDYTVAFGVNLVTPFLETPDHTTDQGSIAVALGDTIEVKGGHSGDGEVGTWYRYIGAAKTVDLTSENFASNTTDWESLGNPLANKGETFVRNLTTYLDGNFGLDNNVVDSWTQATASGGETLNLAGAVTVLSLEHISKAWIAEAAKVNQDDGLRNGQQTVLINAASVNEALHLGGNIQLPGLQGSTTEFTIDTDQLKGGGVVGTEGGKAAVGATVLVLNYDNDVLAQIEDGVELFGDRLTVDASTKAFSIALAASGGKSADFGFNGVAVSVEINNRTYAQIDNGAVVDVAGQVDINAKDTTHIVTIAGGVAAAENVGVGASVGVHQLSRDTQAILGNQLGGDSDLATGRLTAGGAVTLDAINAGFVGGFTVAAAVTSDSPEQEGVADQSVSSDDAVANDDPLDGVSLSNVFGDADPDDSSGAAGNASNNQGKTGVGIAGDVAINLVNDNVRAYLNATGAIALGNNPLALKAEDSTDVASLAGAVAISLGGSQTNVGLAGSLSLNQLGGTTEAFVTGAKLSSLGDLSLDAKRSGDLVAIAAGGAGATGKTGIAVAGSVAINRINRTTQTQFKDVTDGVVNGGIRLTSADDSDMVVVAGSAAFGSKAGVGAAVSFNEIRNTTRATMESVTNLQHSGAMALSATSDSDIISVTGSIGAGRTVGAAGTVSLNWIENAIAATVLNSTTSTGSTGEISLLAQDDSDIFSFSGGFAAGKTVGFGAALAFNNISNRVGAQVQGSSLTTTGALSLTADVTGEITSVSLGAAGAKNVALAGSFSLNEISTTIEATVTDSVVMAGAAVALTATDRSKIFAFGGSLAGAQTVGVGASVAINTISNTVRARVENSTVIANSIALSASSTAEIEALTIGVSGAIAAGNGGNLGIAGAGAASRNQIQNTIEATILNSDESGDENGDGTGSPSRQIEAKAGAVTLEATDSSTINADGGGAALAIAAGQGGAGVSIGASVAINDVENNVKASIKKSKVTAAGKVEVKAKSTTKIDAFTVAGAIAANAGQGGGVAFGGAGAGSGNTINSTTEALIEESSVTTTAAGDISLMAEDESTIKADAGSGSLAGSGGQGGGVAAAGAGAAATNDITNTVRANVTDSALVSAGDLTLLATSMANIDTFSLGIGGALAGGQGGGVSLAGAGSGSGNTVSNTIEALLSGGQVTSTGAVTLTATDQTTITADAGGAAIAGAGGQGGGAAGALGLAIAVNNVANTARANLTDTTVTNAASVTQTAASTTNIEALTIAGALAGAGGQGGGGAFAGAGSGSGNTVNNTVEALIQTGSNVTTVNDGEIKLQATDASTITADAGSGALSGAGGQGGGIAAAGAGAAATNDIGNRVKASIDGSIVNAAGETNLSATSTAKIDTLAVGIGGALAGGQGGGVSLAGAGSGSGNSVNNEIEASLKNGSRVTSGGAVSLSASDESTINADAGGGALGLAGGQGGGVSVAVGASVAINNVENAVFAVVENSIVSAAGNLDLSATSTAKIDTLTVFGTLAGAGGQGGGVAVAGAGAGSGNTVANRVEALIQTGSTVTTTNNGRVSLTAADASTIKSDAGGGALGVAGGQGGGVAVAGAGAAATNDIGNTVRAVVDASTVTASGATTLDATSTADIDTFAISLGGALAGGMGGGVALAGAGSGSGNAVSNTLEALIQGNSTVQAASVEFNATDNANIFADMGAGSLAISGGIGGAVSGALGIAIAANDIANTVRASIDGSKVEAIAGPLSLNATSDSVIEVFGIGGAISVAGAIASAAVALGGANALNKTQSILEASIKNQSDVDATGDISLTAQDTSSIDADLIGFSAAISVVGVALGETVGDNQIDNTVSALIENSAVTTSAGDIQVSAEATQTSQSQATVASVSTGLAGNGGFAKTTFKGKVEAYANEAVLEAEQGTIEIQADSTLTADTEIGGGAGGAIAVTALIAETAIEGSTTAFLSGETTATTSQLAIAATGTNSLTADGLSIGISSIGGSGVGIKATDNRLVEAYVGSALEATAPIPVTNISILGGDLSVDATATSTVTANADVVSVGLLASGAGTDTRVTVSPTARAYLGRQANVNTTMGNATGNVSFEAFADVKGSADGTGVAASGGLAAAGAVVVADVNPTVQAFSVGEGSITGADIRFLSRFNVDETGNATQTQPALAKVTLGSGALLAGAAGGSVTTNTTPTLATTVGAGTVLNATGEVSLLSDALLQSESDGLSVGVGGLIGVGVTLTEANVGGSITTQFDGILESAESLTVRSQVETEAQAEGQASAVSVAGAAGVPVTQAEISTAVTTAAGSTSNITSRGDVRFESSITTDANAVSKVFALGGLAGISVSRTEATIRPQIDTFLATGAQIVSVAGDVELKAFHNFGSDFETDKQAVARTEAFTAALGLSAASNNLTADSSAEVEARVDAGATVQALAGNVAVEALSSNVADAKIVSSGGAAISIQSVNPTATANGQTRAKVLGNIGSQQTLTNALGVEEEQGIAGALNVSVKAQGADLASAKLETSSGGLVTVDASSTADAAAAPVVETQLGGVVVAREDVVAQAISNTDADAIADTRSGGVVTVRSFSATASTTPDVEATVNADGFIQAGEQLTVEAKHGVDASDAPTPQLSDGSFDGTSNVNPSDNTITLAQPHGLSSGNVITYEAPEDTAGNPLPIPGLTDNRSYSVIATSDRQLQLGAAFEAARVDPSTDIIEFASPHNFETGDQVQYEPAGAPVGGLPAGSYNVLRVDATRLKLTPVGGSLPAQSFDPTAPIDKDADDQTPATPRLENSEFFIANHGFTTGQQLTYRAPAAAEFLPQFVDLVSVSEDGTPNYSADDNTIAIDDHGFTTGEKVVYQTTGSAISGLTPNQVYEVVSVSEDRIRLRGKTQLRDITDDEGNVTGQESVIQPIIDIDRTGATGDQFLRRQSELPIAGLTEGDTYSVIRTGNNTFQLAAQLGGAPLVLNPVVNGTALTGNHSLTQDGIDLTAAGAGQLILDITGTATGTHQLDGIGDSSNAIGNAPGDDQVSASATGVVGGVVNVSSVNSSASSNVTVDTTVGEGAVLRGGSIEVASTSGSRASSASLNRGGGFVSVDSTDTNTTVNNTVSTTIGSGASITAQGDATIAANSIQTGTASADTGSGGFIGISTAQAKTQIDHTTDVVVEGSVTAGDALTVRSDSNLEGRNTAIADGSGLGANADANDTSGRGVQIGNTNARTETVLTGEARLTGNTVNVEAEVSRLLGRAESRSDASGFGVDSDAKADIDITDSTEVRLETGAVVDGNTVNLRSGHSDVNLNAKANAKARSAGGDTDATARIDYNSNALVTGADEAEIKTSNLLVDTFQTINRMNRDANRDVPRVSFFGLFNIPVSVDVGSTRREGASNANRTIAWNANVRAEGEPTPEVVISADGRIQQAVNAELRARSAAGALSTPLAVGDLIPAGSTLVVGDIAYDQNSRASFRANDLSGSFPASRITGSTGLFDYQQTFDAVRITNFSDRQIELNNIDVVNQASTPEIDINVDSTTVTFDIQQTFDPTTVSIQTLHAPPNEQTDIVFNGTVNNPIGETVVLNTSGDIRSSKARGETGSDGREALLQTSDLNLLATQGNLGAGPGDRLNLTLIDSPSRSHSARFAAQTDAYLDLQGIFRTPSGEDPVLVIDQIQAGNDIDLLLRDVIQETSAGQTVGGVVVNVVEEGDRQTYFNRFRPDQGIANVLGLGAYAGTATVLSNSNYRFELRDENRDFTGEAGLEAGRDIVIRGDAATAGAINVVGRTDFLPAAPVGQLDIVTSGNIDLTEVDGSLDVRLAESTQNDVLLTVQESADLDENLGIGATGRVQADQGTVELRAGDDVSLAEGGQIRAGETVTIRGDSDNADAEGSVVDLRGTIAGSSAEVITDIDDDIVSLTNVEAGTPTTVRTEAGDDRIQIGSSAAVGDDASGQPVATNTGGTLNRISDLLTIDGGADNAIANATEGDQLLLDESGDTEDNRGILRRDRLIGLGMGDPDPTALNDQAGIAYRNLERLELPLGSGSDELTIESAHSGISVVEAAAGDDTLNVGNGINGVDEIDGPLFLSGQSGASATGKDTLNILDTADTSDNVGQVSETQITGLDMAGEITYDTFEVLNVELGSGNDQLSVTGTGAGETTVKAGPGDDQVAIALTVPVGENIVVINAQAGNDEIDASASTLGMVLNGDEGNDQIEAGSGNDLIGGGGGSDRIDGNAGRDEIYGDSSYAANATDAEYDGFTFPGDAQTAAPSSRPLAVTQASPGNDAIQGGADADTVYGEAGNDDIVGGSTVAGTADGSDHLYGGAGDDAIAGDNATIDPTTGNITPLDAVNGAGDLIFGDGGEIVATTEAGEVSLTARAAAMPGGDRVAGGVGQDIILGDQGRVSLSNGQITRVETTEPSAGGNDDLAGNQDRDVILGGQGSDIIEGDGGRDVLLGDNGRVEYQGGVVRDILTTDSAIGGADRIEGGSDDDVILAGAGDDFVQGGAGDDAIAGDNGLATFAFGGDSIAPADSDLSTLDLLTVVDPTLGGSDILLGGLGDDTIFGGTAGDRIHGDGVSVIGTSGAAPTFSGTAIALGDFDPDGSSDLVLFNPTTRQLAIQYLQGSSVRETQILQAPTIRDQNWNVVAAADFSGDGISELVWQNRRTQQVVFWQVANNRAVSAIVPQFARLGTDWQITGVADFNGDGQSDLLWENQRDGRTRALLMQGSQEIEFVEANPAVAVTTAASAVALRQSLTQARTARAFSDPEQSWQASIAQENSQGGSDADLLLGDHGRRDFNLPFEASYRAIATSDAEGGGNDTIFGGQGDDKILGQQGADNLNGGSGEDDIIGGHNVLGGADANDTISGGDQADVVLGDNGTITRRPLTPNGRDWERYAAPFADVVREVVRFDDVDGVAGDDLIRGDGGDDILHGQRGDDQIEGGLGDDEIHGELGDDTLFGNAGQDTILGDVGLIQRSLNPDGTPQIRANGSWQRSVILTDVGRVLSSQAIASLDAAQLAAADTVLLSGLYNSDATNTAPSGTAAQRIAFLPDGNDRIDGGSGDDRLWGQRGQDTLFGQAGQDYLEGNAGDDILDGGADADWVIGDDGSTLAPGQDSLPTVNRGIHLIATDTAAVQLDRFGNVVLPGIRLDANPFHGLLPVLSLAPEVANDSRLRPLISGFGTPQGQVFQPLIQIIPDLANHRDLLMGQDQLQGGEGQDTVIGDSFASLMPLRTGNGAIDREVEELIRELYQTRYDLHDLEVLTQPTGQTLVLGQDSLDGGGDNDFVVGDNGISFGPFEQASPSEPSFSLTEVQTLRSLLQQFGSRVTALTPATSNNPINTLRLGNDSLFGSGGNDSLFGDDAVVISPLLDTVPYTPGSFFDYGFSQERRPTSRRINDWTVVWGNDQIEGGAGLDLAVGDYGTLLTPVVTASTADPAALQLSLENLTADLNAFIRDNFQADNGLSNDLRNQTFQAGQDSLSGGANDDVLVGDNATLLLPFINGQVDRSLSLSRERLDTLDQAQNFFHGLPHQLYTQPRSAGLDLPNFAADTLAGGDGNDILFGLRGPDTLNGDQGDDFLFGGAEQDNLLDVLGNNIQRSTNPSRADLRDIRTPVDARLAEVLSPGLREQLLLIANQQRSLRPDGRLVARFS